MKGLYIVVLAVVVVTSATLLTALKVMPTEATAGILGALATAVSTLLTRNQIVSAVQQSMRPPPLKKEDGDSSESD